MKLKVSQLIEMNVPLRRLAECALPAAASFKVSQVMRKLIDPINAAIMERDKLIMKHGRQIPGTESYQVLDTKMDSFRAELVPLLDMEEDVAIEPIPLSLIADAKLSALDMAALEPLVNGAE